MAESHVAVTATEEALVLVGADGGPLVGVAPSEQARNASEEPEQATTPNDVAPAAAPPVAPAESPVAADVFEDLPGRRRRTSP